jgi:endonuclease/exonuclease/phosphatase family metal-dependent hydrolase
MQRSFFKNVLRVLLVAFLFVSAGTTRAAAQPVTNLSVMSFNVLVSGQRGLTNIAEAIRRAGADVVGLQEIASSPSAITQLATNLGFYRLPGVSVLSRYPILGASVPGVGEVQNGVTIELSPGQRVHLFNCHLAPFPYGPYYIRDGQSSNATINLESTTRLPQITNLLSFMAPYLATDEPCFLTGDFNAPSHVDYANFPWPVSKAVHTVGLEDSYRLLHSGNRQFPPAFAFDEPGITWTPDGAALDNTFDRIDFVYFSGNDGVTPLTSAEHDSRNNLSPWPSDHRAVVSTFRLTLPKQELQATRPFPLTGATKVATNTSLSWLSGSNATSHIILFGSMTNASNSLIVTQATATFNPGPLAPNTTFFWRVDEVTPSGVASGNIWTFTTLDPNASTVYEWTFDSTNLQAALGRGTMTYADSATPGLTTFATTDGTTVAHIGGQPAKYLSVPAFTGVSNGYLLSLTDSGPNGGGAYINQFTFVFDVFVPGSLNWTALFNTNPLNENDADWYLDNLGRVGIGDLGYSANGVIIANTWQRLVFAADLGAGVVTFYRNGTQVRQRTGVSLLDGRFSLYSNIDPGADVLLFNENDTSGVYTHAIYVNSVAFTDRTLSAADVAALGGPRAEGIFVRRLRAQRNGADLSLTWYGASNTRLQRTASLSSPNWQDVPGTANADSYTQPATNSAAFFRLIQQ